MADTDSLRRFVFERHNIRGELVHLNASWGAVLERHAYLPVVRELLGESLGASVLLTSTLKFDGSLTLQLQSDGALSLLVAQCTSRRTIRGLAHLRDDVPAPADFAALTRAGRLAITIEPHDGRRRYQGIVPLEGASMAACVEHYFARSEQLPTRLWLAANDDAVVGMLLQVLPEDTRTAAAHAGDEDAWNRVCTLADTLTRGELLALDDQQILHRLFHEEDVRLFDREPISFRCSCSRERISAALRGLGRSEIDGIIAEQGMISTTCEFCNRRYSFDSVDAAGLFAVPPAPPSDTQH